MYRLMLVCAPLLLVAAQPPALAKEPTQTGNNKRCEPKKKKKSGGFMKSIAGNVAGAALGRAGVPTGVMGVSLPVTSLLTDAILSRLDCKEQVQAATATNEAVRGGVGTTATWESETRPGVKGSSTVRDQRASADGSSCMTVSDVIIVNGEETTVPKTMCRRPGASGYVLAA